MRSIKYISLGSLVVALALGGCQSANTVPEEAATTGTGGCSLDDDLSKIENEITTAIEQTVSDVDDFVVVLHHSSGRRFVHSSGNASLNTLYESASTSKWISATVILWLVAKGVMTLEDGPDDYLPGIWTASGSDPRANIKLHHLLSFTSGLTRDPGCVRLGLPQISMQDCVKRIFATANEGTPPGTAFHYGSSHLQVAGLMAVRAMNVTLWQDVFDAFKKETLLFEQSVYDLPTVNHPRLAGGMHWSAAEYMAFLSAWRDDQLLPPALKKRVLADQMAGLQITSSPAQSELEKDWHYGYGFWLECDDPIYSCTDVRKISSPGAFGAYPFIDYEHDYFGMLARQGAVGTFPKGHAFMTSLKPLTEAWADTRCP